MFMSYPAAGHLQLRISPIAGGCLLVLRHRVLGFIDDEHRKGVSSGWQQILGHIKNGAEE